MGNHAADFIFPTAQHSCPHNMRCVWSVLLCQPGHILVVVHSLEKNKQCPLQRISEFQIWTDKYAKSCEVTKPLRLSLHKLNKGCRTWAVGPCLRTTWPQDYLAWWLQAIPFTSPPGRAADPVSAVSVCVYGTLTCLWLTGGTTLFQTCCLILSLSTGPTVSTSKCSAMKSQLACSPEVLNYCTIYYHCDYFLTLLVIYERLNILKNNLAK